MLPPAGVPPPGQCRAPAWRGPPLTEDNAGPELLFSQNYITASFAPRQGEPLNLYSGDTKTAYTLTDVSDGLGKALMMEMAQTACALTARSA